MSTNNTSLPTEMVNEYNAKLEAAHKAIEAAREALSELERAARDLSSEARSCEFRAYSREADTITLSAFDTEMIRNAQSNYLLIDNAERLIGDVYYSILLNSLRTIINAEDIK